MSDLPQSLIDAVQKGELIPFVGAGLSLSVGQGLFPSWPALIEIFADRLESEALGADADRVREFAGKGDLPQAAEQAFAALTKPRFVEEMQKVFEVPRPAKADLSAVEAMWRLRPRLVITTNYESVLEWPLSPLPGAPPSGLAPGGPRLIHNDDPALLRQLEIGRPDRPLIWHLHGSIRRPDTLILTHAQYKTLYAEGSTQYSLYRFAFDQLRQILAKRPLLFIGFSLQDPFLLRQMEEVLALTFQGSPMSYMLVRKDQSVPLLLAKYHVQRIEFESFGAPMVERLIEIGRSAWGDGYSVRTNPDLPPGLAPLVGELEKILHTVVLEPARVARAFNRAKPPAWPVLPLSGDGWSFLSHSVVQLGAALRQGLDGPFPLLEFVREVETCCAPEVRAQLQAWREQAAGSLARDEADRERLVQGFPPKVKPAADPYILLRVVEESSGRYRAQAWLFASDVPEKIFGDERVCTRPELLPIVNDILNTLEALEVDPDRATLAFLLPRDLLVEEVDQWQPVEMVAELPIGATYAVNVRSLERLSYQRSMRRLRRAWQSLQSAGEVPLTVADVAALAGGTGSRAVWLSPEDGSRPGIAQTLEASGISCAILAGTPPAQPSEPVRDLFNAVLQAGIPVVLWVRDPASRDLGKARAKVEELLAGTPARTLSQRIRLQRRAAALCSDPDHPGRCLTLLWDDPERLPPDQDPGNRAVVLRA
jgi:hypothetical protein